MSGSVNKKQFDGFDNENRISLLEIAQNNNILNYLCAFIFRSHLFLGTNWIDKSQSPITTKYNQHDDIK